MERPNTIAGLTAKHRELTKLRAMLEAELRKVTCDLDHVDACIRLFDPANTAAARKRYATKHRAKKGALKRFVLAMLKDASAPVTSRDITQAWIADRGLKADDETFVLLRKRVGACVTALKADGLVAEVPLPGDYKGWRLNQG